MADLQIYPNPQSLAQAAAERLIHAADEAVRARDIFSVALAGGSTPQMLYQLLATEPYSERIDWSKTHFFWGDERCVPPDHPESNYGKACQALLYHVPVPESHLHRITAEIKPELAASAYEETLLAFFTRSSSGSASPETTFDLTLLGMGDDGHTASLFPGNAGVFEQTRWVVAQYVDKLAAWRVSLTPPALNRSREVLFLVSGASKSSALQRVVYGTLNPERYPAQAIRPELGKLTWLVDEAAAELL